MSSYMEFFIKDMNRLISVGSFSRSHEVYSAFEGAPYGKLEKLNSFCICKAAGKLKREIQQLGENRAELIREEKNIWASNNPISEKREAAAEVRESVADIDELIEDKKFALGVIRTLNIMEEQLEVYEDSNKAARSARLFYGIDADLEKVENSEEEKI